VARLDHEPLLAAVTVFCDNGGPCREPGGDVVGVEEVDVRGRLRWYDEGAEEPDVPEGRGVRASRGSANVALASFFWSGGVVSTSSAFLFPLLVLDARIGVDVIGTRSSDGSLADRSGCGRAGEVPGVGAVTASVGGWSIDEEGAAAPALPGNMEAMGSFAVDGGVCSLPFDLFELLVDGSCILISNSRLSPPLLFRFVERS